MRPRQDLFIARFKKLYPNGIDHLITETGVKKLYRIKKNTLGNVMWY
jgi:hypothetical protein